MVDQINTDPVVNQDPPADDPGVKSDPVNKDDKNDPRNNPLYSRVQELSRKNKDLADAMAQIEDDREKVQAEALKKQGEYKTLYEGEVAKNETLSSDLKDYQGKWDGHVETQTQAVNAMMDEIKVSESDRNMAMQFNDLDLRRAFVERIADKEITTSTDTRRNTNRVETGKLKPMSQMSDQEIRDTHEQRLAQYDK